MKWIYVEYMHTHHTIPFQGKQCYAESQKKVRNNKPNKLKTYNNKKERNHN